MATNESPRSSREWLLGELKTRSSVGNPKFAPWEAVLARMEKNGYVVPSPEKLVPPTKDERVRTIIKEYARNPWDRDTVSKTWSELWKSENWGDDFYEYDVPDCDRTSDEIEELHDEGRMMVYVPPALSTKESRFLLLQEFEPYVTVSNGEEVRGVNTKEQSGWIDVEYDVRYDHPTRGLTPSEADTALQKRGRTGQTLNTYIVASVFHRLIYGQFFDDLVPSRITGTNHAGHPIYISYYQPSNSYELISDHTLLGLGDEWNTSEHHPQIVTRSAGMKKAA